MEITKRNSATELEVKKAFPKEELTALEESLLKEEAKSIKLPGFRNGKAPLVKVREMLIESGKWVEALNVALQRSFLFDWDQKFGSTEGEIVQILDFKSAGEDPLTIEFSFEIFPRLKTDALGDIYKKIEVKEKKNDFKVEDKEVEDTLAELQRRRTILQPSTGGVEKGKDVFLKITNLKNEKVVQDIFHYGKNKYGLSFEEALGGMLEGEEKTLKLSLEKEVLAANPQLENLALEAGEESEVTVRVEKIFSAEKPEINDEFAKSLGNFNNLEELKQNLKDGILLEKKHQEKERRREAVALFLLEKIDLTVPKSIVKRSFNEEKKRLKDHLEKQSAEKREEIEKTVEKRLADEIKLQRIIETIALEEKIVPEDKEVEEETAKILSQYKTAEEAEKSVGKAEDFKSRVFLSLCYQKTFNYLEEINKISDDLKI